MNYYRFVFIIFLIIVSVMSCAKEEDELTTSSSTNISEGSVNTPISLEVGTPYSGSVDSWDYSYYKFTTSNSGNYKLEMSNLSIETGGSYYISAHIYEDSSFSNRITYDSCESNCIFNFDYDNLDQNKTYYLRMYSWDDSYYKLNLSKGGSEGSINYPVTLNLGQSESGTVEGRGYYGQSYYKFTTKSSDNITINMTNSTSLDATLYSDDAYSTNFTYCDASNNLKCEITNSYYRTIVANTTYYFKIYFPSTINTISTVSYNITVSQ